MPLLLNSLFFRQFMRHCPKILWLPWLALLPGPAAHAQAIAAADVPPLAYGAMFQQYPQARQITWRRFQDWYQASYTQGPARRLVRFSSDGDVEATGQDMALGALSLPIQYVLATYYPTLPYPHVSPRNRGHQCPHRGPHLRNGHLRNRP